MKRYICTDLHGYLDLYEQIKSYVEPDDIIYNLGDSGDRGPQPYETLKAVLTDPQFICLLGNHDAMLYKTIISEYHKNEDPWGYRECSNLLGYNGGKKTFKDYKKDTKENKATIRQILANLPTHLEIINNKGQEVLLSHAGYTPSAEAIKFIAEREIREGLYIPDDEDLIWDRKHLLDEWDMENFPNTYVVHGHTPIKDKWLTDNGIYRYAKGHKIDIDRQTYNREDCVLLDLDNLEAAPIKFQVKKREDEERKNG